MTTSRLTPAKICFRNEAKQKPNWVSFKFTLTDCVVNESGLLYITGMALGMLQWSEYKQCFSQSCQLIIFNGGISVSKWLLEYSGKTLKRFLWAWECMSSDYNQWFLCSYQLSNTLNWDFRRVNGASQNLLRINLASYWCSFDSISDHAMENPIWIAAVHTVEDVT